MRVGGRRIHDHPVERRQRAIDAGPESRARGVGKRLLGALDDDGEHPCRLLWPGAQRAHQRRPFLRRQRAAQQAVVRLQGDVGRVFFARSQLEHADVLDAVLHQQSPDPAVPQDGLRFHGHNVQQLIHLRFGQPGQHQQLPDAEGVQLQREAVDRVAPLEGAAFKDQTIAVGFQNESPVALVKGANGAQKDGDRLGAERVSGSIQAPGLHRRVEAAGNVGSRLSAAPNGHM